MLINIAIISLDVGLSVSLAVCMIKLRKLTLFRNLRARKEMREACWEVDGWAKTVYNTGMIVI